MPGDQLPTALPESLKAIPNIGETIARIAEQSGISQQQMANVLAAMHTDNVLREDRSHNGWTNYETWNGHLWLTSDESTHAVCEATAEECVEEAPETGQVQDGIWSEIEARRFLLADRLKEFVEEGNPLQDHASMFSDLLTAAIEEVDWHEIAEAFLPEDDGQE